MKLAAFALAIAGIFVISAGPAGSAGPASAGPEAAARGSKACTEIGCDSALYADLSQIRVAFPGIRKLKVCIDRKCRVLRSRNLDQSFRVMRKKLDGRRHTVRFVARGKGGRVLGRDTYRARSRRWQPNGKGCPPVCFVVEVRVNSKGRLVPIIGIE